MSSNREFHGSYMGIVKDVNDPEKRGGIKCQIPEVSGELISWWVYPKTANGSINVPPIGKKVNIEFENGDPNRPVLAGVRDTAPGNKAETSEASRGKKTFSNKGPITVNKAGPTGGSEEHSGGQPSPTYPKNKVDETPGGIIVERDDSTGRYHIYVPCGSSFELDGSGNVTVRATGKMFIEASSLNVKGDLNVEGSVSTKTGSSSTFMDGAITMNSGTKGAARQDDAIEVVDSQGVLCVGKITGGSGTCKIGD